MLDAPISGGATGAQRRQLAIWVGGDKAVFELNQGDHHDHLVCLQCGKVEEFFDSEIEKRQARIAKERGFVIREHSLQLYADCIKENCPNRKPGESRQR